MPTGYTAAVNDGSITTLRDYALTCARAFGALIEMRDDPLSAKAPRRLPPRDSYHRQALAEATAQLATIQAMPEDDRVKAAAGYNKANDTARIEAVEKNDQLRQRYDAMIAQVETWKGGPAELKKFMLEQLEESLKFDVSDNPGEYIPQPKTVEQWHADALKEAVRNVEYHAKHLREDMERETERQAWLDKLWAALPEEENV